MQLASPKTTHRKHQTAKTKVKAAKLVLMHEEVFPFGPHSTYFFIP